LIIVLALALIVGGLYLWRSVGPGRPEGADSPSPEVSGVLSGPVASPSPDAPADPTTMPDRPNTLLQDVWVPGFVDPPPGQGLERYLQQTVDWQACSVGQVEARCADIAVPLDYDYPDWRAITLALVVRPAQSPGLGPLFINPGGPGAPGRTMPFMIDAAALPGYDLVGWDPRGTGDSTPVVCDTDLDQLRSHDVSPDDAAEEQALIQAWRDFDQSCAAGSGSLLGFISTADTVADLDLMRALLGASQLNYLGFSYGTAIGALYADTHPELVGRMVLDSPVDITGDETVDQAMGFEQAFDHFAQWCGQQACRLGQTAEAVASATIAWLDDLDQAPVPVGERQLTQSLALDGIAYFLYFDASVYPYLAQAVADAWDGRGEDLLTAADDLWERDANGAYSTLLPAFTAIRCLDEADDGLAAALKRWAGRSSWFARLSGPDLACAVWPLGALPAPRLTAAGAAPILVVGATGDSATPYQYAQGMVQQMPSAVLLTYDGPGHATYSGRNDCIDAAVNRYFNQGVLPEAGTVCR
jgi:pimeloyl-ACP methyl ester carboxylesterase